MSYEVSVTFGISEIESLDEDRYRVGSSDGLRDILKLDARDVSSLEEVTGGSACFRHGGYGRGAEGPGIQLILGVSDNLVSTVAGLLVLGEALRRAIKKATSRGVRQRIAITDSATLGAMAISGSKELRETLLGMEFHASRPLGRDFHPGAGVDNREVWYSEFHSEEEGFSILIFMAPSGLILGSTRVPFAQYWTGQDWKVRGSREIKEFHEQQGR